MVVEPPDERSATGSRLLEAIGRRAIDTLPLTVAILDDDGAIVETNESWQTFGRNNDLEGSPDSIGENYLEICDRADDERATEAASGIRDVLSGETDAFSLEYPCHSPSERRWFLLRATPFAFEGDRYVTVAHTDITDRKLAELAAERRAEELDAEREIHALLNQIVRHDIRNDMNVAQGWASMLEDHVDEEGREALSYIERSVSHAVELTHTVAEVAEEITGGSPAGDDLEPVSLGDVLVSEIEKVRTTYDRRHEPVEIVTPALDEEITVLADGLLSSVFSNLLSNAVLHNDKPEPRVDVSVATTADAATVRIADNGPGVPTELRDSLFDREEKSLESPGQGLGLYLVDTLVARYGGEVRVHDNDPEGAVFEVVLRRA